jgi:hypothetical protein
LSAKKKTGKRALALWDDMIMGMPYGIQQQQQIQLVKAATEKEFLIVAVDI